MDRCLMLCVPLLAACGVSAMAQEPSLMWCPGVKDADADSYVAFRGHFELPADTHIELRTHGASWFVVWLNGQYVTEGPARFHIRHPEYQVHSLNLPAGKHVLAVQVHHIGVVTRMLDNMLPFLYAVVRAGDRDIPIQWKCARLGGYAPQVKRLNPQFGWIEWCDTRHIPVRWREAAFDDTAWAAPVPAKTRIGPLKPVTIASVQSFTHPGKIIAQGPLAESFGYELDNQAARFFLRDLSCQKLPPQGLWRRYDLGRVRLMRPRFVLDLPAGSVVEFAYSEALAHDRVSPWITLSAGDSCNLDHYVARGGPQEFFPLTPRGGRFVEIHVLAPTDQIRFLKEEFIERCYYDRPQGAFTCADDLLNRIWSVGIETHRACAEDALIDNPTRERGQWAGDVVTVGMDIAAAGYSDVRLCRRGLVQCAQCAREDGLIAGLCPGGPAFLSTYSAQWITACVHYWELTGDRTLLEELFDAAERNIAAFEKAVTADGVKDDLGWAFVDWGYVRNEGPVDIGTNLHYFGGLRDMVRWCRELNKPERASHYQQAADRIAAIVRRYFDSQKKGQRFDWDKIGYHRAALGLKLGFFQAAAEQECIAFMKAHILRCFPNDSDAPRLSDPGRNQSRLITPYFAHYAMPLLIERGMMDFVLDQYRKCWGWALQDDRTTWVEVFDTRWTHCHQWAGCPTWQLTRYALGLTPRYDLGPRHYALSLLPGSLDRAEGAIPLPDGSGSIRVSWTRTGQGLQYTIQTPRPIHLHHGKRIPSRDEVISIEREATLVVPP